MFGLLIFVFALTTAWLAPGQTAGEDLDARMKRYNRSLGVECTHCHVEGSWADESKPEFDIARNMSKMVPAVNEHLGEADRVSCWTCHRGEVRPSRQPAPAMDTELEKWPGELANASASLKATMAVYNVALGVGCDHCHTADWKADEKPSMKKVALMNGLFTIFPKFIPPKARTQCFMCHKGSTKPAQ
jgi:photosynthetic reaction center cytochrome c subunit